MLALVSRRIRSVPKHNTQWKFKRKEGKYKSKKDRRGQSARYGNVKTQRERD
jgi:hypothetical protein